MSPAIESREHRQFAAELKFPLRRELAPQVLAWARERMLPDPNALEGDTYEVTSLYFDTEAMDVFHRRGSFKRSKYRVRRYGESEVAYLERKLRTPAMLTKRRSAAALDAFGAVVLDSEQEAEWFRQRVLLRGLKPRCQISYRRTARIAHSPHGLMRLTLDDQLRVAPVEQWQFVHLEKTRPVAENHVILELKFLCTVPVLFKELVAEFGLSPQSHSKYRRAMNELGLAVPDSPALLCA